MQNETLESQDRLEEIKYFLSPYVPGDKIELYMGLIRIHGRSCFVEGQMAQLKSSLAHHESMKVKS